MRPLEGWGSIVNRYRQIETRSSEELAGAVPGGRFRFFPLAKAAFAGRHCYLMLDGLVLNHVALGQASIVVAGERDRNSTTCLVAGPRAALNGRPFGEGELALVHPGDAYTLLTAEDARSHSFTLEADVCAASPELDLPSGFPGDYRPGRWRAASGAAVQRFVRLVDGIFAQLATQPSLAESPAARTSLRDAALKAIAGLADDGAFVPDIATARRHTQIMLRFQRALEEIAPESLDMPTLCSSAGTSRRSLEAIVRARTGRSPWDYLRWRRLLSARERLSAPGSTTHVTGIAFDLGIWHLGRFARDYATVFGETPAETLRRARGAAGAPPRE